MFEFCDLGDDEFVQLEGRFLYLSEAVGVVAGACGVSNDPVDLAGF